MSLHCLTAELQKVYSGQIASQLSDCKVIGKIMEKPKWMNTVIDSHVPKSIKIIQRFLGIRRKFVLKMLRFGFIEANTPTHTIVDVYMGKRKIGHRAFEKKAIAFRRYDSL
jgi:hypothetical protein